MRSTSKLLYGLLAIGVIAVAAVVTADSTTNNDYTHAYNADGTPMVLPRVRIVNFDETVAKFDTTNGALHRFHGELRGDNVGGRWVLAVPPITGETSGMLQMQNSVGVENVASTVFLVDAVTGRTWILELSDSDRRARTGVWEEVREYR